MWVDSDKPILTVRPLRASIETKCSLHRLQAHLHKHASKQRCGYAGHCGVVLIRRQQNARGRGTVPPPSP
jgi:hypothetical protein